MSYPKGKQKRNDHDKEKNEGKNRGTHKEREGNKMHIKGEHTMQMK